MLDELRDLYQEVILDHDKHPRNFRHPDDANREAQGRQPDVRRQGHGLPEGQR